MLVVDSHETPEHAVRLRLEGRLVGPWVREVDRLAGPLLLSGRQIVVDLGGVAFADRGGVELLRRLRDGGVELRNGSAFVRTQLEGGAGE